MAKDELYAQCEMLHDLGNGSVRVEVAWIPERFAKAGKNLYFGPKGQDGPPLYTVHSVWAKKHYSQLEEREMRHGIRRYS